MPKYLTTEEWIERFRSKHGDRYDYSKVVTQSQKHPVTIICPDHGEFQKTPIAHGRDGKPCDGCLKDSELVRRGADYINKFVAMHGDKFDYSKVEFRGASKPVTVICPSHGEFSVAPANHLRSESGCRKCGHVEKLGTKPTKSELTPMERFIEKHGDKYDYSLVEYKGNQTKVTIVCPDHGEFQVSPVMHWSGSGCKQCNTKSIDQDECIRRFRAQHGDKFDYSETAFISQTEAVTVICPSHGRFEVQPVNHWKTQNGCKGCAYEQRKLKSSEELVARFMKVHGDAYLYENFVYDKMHSLSIITCKKHGDFPMSPANHLADHGCPSCWQNTKSKPETAWGEAIATATGWHLKQGVKVAGVSSVIDFVVRETEYGPIAIEYDGHYWHSRPEVTSRDIAKTAQLNDAGYTVVRLRADEGRLDPLPHVPGAINVYVLPTPDDEGTILAVKEIVSALSDLTL